MIASVDQVITDAKQQGLARRNVVESVNRVAVQHNDVDTNAEAEGWAKDRIRELPELRKSTASTRPTPSRSCCQCRCSAKTRRAPARS